MGTEERDDRIDKRKPSKQMSSIEVGRQAKPHKHKETSAAPFLAPQLLNSLQYGNQQIYRAQDGSLLSNSQLYYYPQAMPPNGAPQLYPVYYYNPPHAYSNAVGYAFQDFTLPVSEKGKDNSSKEMLNSMRQSEGSSEAVGLYVDKSSRSEMEGETSNRNYSHDHPRSVACGDNEASSDEIYDPEQDLSATKKPRLIKITVNDDSTMADSALDKLETAPILAMNHSIVGPVSKTTNSSDDYEMRMQRRREMNRESAKRSRLRKQEIEKLQAEIEALKADTSMLCEELKNLSEECERLDEENKQIKEELVEMCGPSVINDLAASWPELREQQKESNVEMKLTLTVVK